MRRNRHGTWAEVGEELEAGLAPEVEGTLARGVEPVRRGARAQRRVGLADAEGRPVQGQVRVGVGGLRRHAVGSPPVRLGEPGRGRAGRVHLGEAERGSLRRPRERDAAAVPAADLAAGAAERGVLAGPGRDVEHFRQAKLLTLVDVRGAGQGEQQQGRRAGLAGAKAGDRTLHVMVAEHPGGL
jgi:hypothetical protein